jgi:hypothetical protein
MSRYIHDRIKKELLEETNYRCASCLCSIEYVFNDGNFFRFDEKAHATPYSETQDNSFENLITLCPTCHTKYDKHPEKAESVTRLRRLKRQWIEASGKYSKLELDLLFDLYNERDDVEWIRILNNPKDNDGKQINQRAFLLMSYLSLPLLRNLAENNLILCVDNGMKGIKLSGRTLGDVPMGPVVFAITEQGYQFCQKFFPET